MTPKEVQEQLMMLGLSSPAAVVFCVFVFVLLCFFFWGGGGGLLSDIYIYMI